jgi:hypothetical protein
VAQKPNKSNHANLQMLLSFVKKHWKNANINNPVFEALGVNRV